MAHKIVLGFMYSSGAMLSDGTDAPIEFQVVVELLSRLRSLMNVDSRGSRQQILLLKSWASALEPRSLLIILGRFIHVHIRTVMACGKVLL
jgi:hypothetical protein